MKFEFKAYDQSGNYLEGVITANQREEALAKLQSQNLLVTFLRPAHERVLLTFLPRITKKDLFLFTKQLSYLIAAKVPLDESIKSLATAPLKKEFRGVLVEIYEKIVSGIPFSKALEDFSEIFDPFYIRMIKVGEIAGKLQEVLEYLASHLEYQIRFKNKVKQAIIYPVIVLVLFIVTMLVLFYYVIPQITNIFVQNNIPLPTITKVLSIFSNFLLNYGLLLILILLFLAYLGWNYLRSEEGKIFIFTTIEKMPILGPLVKNTYLAGFLESLYYMIAGGVSLAETFIIISESSEHPVYRKVVYEIGELVKKGSDLSSAMKNYPEIFPSTVVQAVSIGEKTGELKEMLEAMIKYYREDIENRSATVGEALQPILIIFLGGALALLELSLLLPLLNLTKSVQSL